MSQTIHLPDEAARTFRDTWGDALDRTALEALVIQGYRQRRFGISTVRRLLGFGSRWEAEEWLGSQGVNWNYSVDDLEADRRTLALD
jgi:hypothetical protein